VGQEELWRFQLSGSVVLGLSLYEAVLPQKVEVLAIPLEEPALEVDSSYSDIDGKMLLHMTLKTACTMILIARVEI